MRYALLDLEAEPEGVSFLIGFDGETEIIGYPKVRLFVEADGSDDMDVFVLLQELDADGVALEQFNVPNHGEPIATFTRSGASILNYKGSNGRLRVSLRKLDEEVSTDEVPAHAFDTVEKLAPGEVVQIEIDMFPVGLALHPGEQLWLTASGTNLLGGVMPNVPDRTPQNHGRHVLHTGGARASYLQVGVR